MGKYSRWVCHTLYMPQAYNVGANLWAAHHVLTCTRQIIAEQEVRKATVQHRGRAKLVYQSVYM